VGYYYAYKPVPLCLDQILVRGIAVKTHRTKYTLRAREVTDHLPTRVHANWVPEGTSATAPAR
jgi:endonuclease/exonuclease/phosphatase family metal-dependent hydrolase